MLRLLVVLLLLVSSGVALACRCAQQSLAEYYAAADEVFVATLTATIPHNDKEQQFRFEKAGESYKSSALSLPYVSSLSSAACAVQSQPGAVYVVFAQHDLAAGVARINSCNGTRIHRAFDGTTFGFEDVPARFVVAQLTAQSGLTALQRISRVEGEPDNAENTALLGLLDVAALTHTEEIPVFAAPCSEASVIAILRTYDDIESRESSYEQVAAIVFATINGWYKIRLNDGAFGWLAPDAAGTYWPLRSLLPNRLNYLTQDWNGLVWPELGAGIPRRLSYDGVSRPRERAANILRAESIAGSLWLQVEILESSPCEGGESKAGARGWIPAYTETGTSAAWFYSRGC